MENSIDYSKMSKTEPHSTLGNKDLAKVIPILRKKLDRAFGIEDYFRDTHHDQGDI
jgi:hypothetical protein